MRCFFDLHEGAYHFADYADMLKVAIVSLRRHTSLVPVVVYDGWPNAFTDWLDAQAVDIVYRRSLLYPELVRLGAATGNPAYMAHGPGVLLKLDLTDVCEERGWADETLVFCDCDVLFLGDPVPLWPDLGDSCFAVGPEDDPGVPERMNTGVMLVNVAAFRKHAEAFRRFTAGILPEAISVSWDQHAYRLYFKEFGWKSLAPALNWKPYWGVNPGAKIVHFHGPKPFLRPEISAGRAHAAHAPLIGEGFMHYCAAWDKALAEARDATLH
jgi:hypothetical protein